MHSEQAAVSGQVAGRWRASTSDRCHGPAEMAVGRVEVAGRERGAAALNLGVVGVFLSAGIGHDSSPWDMQTLQRVRRMPRRRVHLGGPWPGCCHRARLLPEPLAARLMGGALTWAERNRGCRLLRLLAGAPNTRPSRARSRSPSSPVSRSVRWRARGELVAGGGEEGFWARSWRRSRSANHASRHIAMILRVALPMMSTGQLRRERRSRRPSAPTTRLAGGEHTCGSVRADQRRSEQTIRLHEDAEVPGPALR